VPVTVHYEGADGVRIVGDRLGAPGAPPVVFLHGGGQTRHSWGGTATAVVGRGWQAVSLDLRGHGESDWSAAGDYRIVSFAGDVRAVLTHLPQRPVLVGASLGGLTSLLLTGELELGVARAVVLVDIVPDMEPEGASRIHAFMIERAEEGFASLDEVADSIAAYNPMRRRPADLQGLRKNLRRRGERWFWHWDPAFISGNAPLPPAEVLDVDRLHEATSAIVDSGTPVLLVRGRMSDLVSEEKAQEFIARFPAVEFADVSGAGHMVAGDRNDAFTRAVLEFLRRRVGEPDPPPDRDRAA
jgi:pimeloyl-ACP methyl ester carboxylesterase